MGKCQTASYRKDVWGGRGWAGDSHNEIRPLRSELMEELQEFHWRLQGRRTLHLKSRPPEKTSRKADGALDHLRRIFQTWARHSGNLPSPWISHFTPNNVIICHLACCGVTAFGNWEFGKVPDTWTTNSLRPLHDQNGHLEASTSSLCSGFLIFTDGYYKGLFSLQLLLRQMKQLSKDEWDGAC